MILIGIHGKRGVGKDTVAKIMSEQLNGVKLVALADRLKEVSSKLFDVPLETFYSEALKEVPCKNGMSPRDIMIRISKALRPEFGDNLFIDPIKAIIGTEEIKKRGLIVTDIRGEHEASFIRENRGVIFHLHRPNMPKKTEINHWSEEGIKVHKSDVVLVIQEGLEELPKFICGAIKDHIIADKGLTKPK